MEKEVFDKIVEKKNFSDLPKKDVERIYTLYSKKNISEREKIKMTRDLLRKVYSGFSGKKLFVKGKNYDENILKKHLSTRERFDFYEEVYSRIFQDFNKKGKLSVVDLGAGINGLSFKFFSQLGYDVNYLGIEAVGQFVDLMNNYFSDNKFNAKAIQVSLFDYEEIIGFIKKVKDKKIIFMFKVVDCLEMVEKNFSLKFFDEMSKLDFEKLVVSFATRSWFKRKKFFVSRNWVMDYFNKNFNIEDDFEIGGERYFVLRKIN